MHVISNVCLGNLLALILGVDVTSVLQQHIDSVSLTSDSKTMPYF